MVVEAGSAPRPTDRAPRYAMPPAGVLWPLAAAVGNGIAFGLVQPDVGDLQAALARQSAAAHGVGLTYWFTWFGGGTTPGNYSVLTPYLSTVLGGAVLVGVLATIAIPLLAYRAFADTRWQLAGTWIATMTSGLNIWSGRVPFALGGAVALVSVIGVRSRRPLLTVSGAVVTSLCSPVTGVFLAFGLAAAFFAEREHRRQIALACASCGATLLVVAIVFGNPGTQPYALIDGILGAATALIMLAAQPAPGVRVALWFTAIVGPLLSVVPNGLGSNFGRFPWICLPAAVIATASSRKLVAAIAILPALGFCIGVTTRDLVRAYQPEASIAYYQPLIHTLNGLRDLKNYRVEVVQNPEIHTAAVALVDTVALAGGYETQAARSLNAVLYDPDQLNPTSYKVWLLNNSVGWVAFNRRSDSESPEYQLVRDGGLGYLDEVHSGSRWIVYRFTQAAPIVNPPERLVSMSQADLTIDVPCACTFPVRIRYSKFLSAATETGDDRAQIADDGYGWSVVTTPAAGRYIFNGSFG
jgi:hypothetical protein